MLRRRVSAALAGALLALAAPAAAQPCTTDSLGNLRCPAGPAPFAGDLTTMGDAPTARLLDLAPPQALLPAPPAAIPGMAPERRQGAPLAAPRPLPRPEAQPGLRRSIGGRLCAADSLGNVTCR